MMGFILGMACGVSFVWVIYHPLWGQPIWADSLHDTVWSWFVKR